VAKKDREWIYGRHPVREVLRADRRKLVRLLLAEGITESPLIHFIQQLAEAKGVPIQRVKRSRLDERQIPHQGVVLVADPYLYLEVADLISKDKEKDQDTLFLLLDLVQDPQNLGTLLRTAEAVGVEGVVIPTRRAVGITPAVVSASAGACEHLSIAKGNLVRAIEALKAQSVWIAGLDRGEDAVRYDLADFSGSTAIVVGSESQGLRRLVREACDFIVELPMVGQIDSLNAAVAGSIVLYHILGVKSSHSLD
jgi:23S rRNA (guanosine2251-2'-O)-methyltransferase